MMKNGCIKILDRMCRARNFSECLRLDMQFVAIILRFSARTAQHWLISCVIAMKYSMWNTVIFLLYLGLGLKVNYKYDVGEVI